MYPTYLQLQQLSLLGYSINSQDIRKTTSCVIDPFCNSWTIVNIGDVWVTVNGTLVKGYPIGHPELTGASLSATGNFGEVYKGLVQVNEASTTPGSGTTVFHCIFIQKIYNF